ncbi:AMP-binding protein [Streptomyces chartreusis]|uniref:AMP-binding protein n=1 Tax=Streptomyces chartreusis TaxID=1969 RepID=UPI002100A39D|nr:AMP-binding protein [Streptomyces chartreusis]
MIYKSRHSDVAVVDRPIHEWVLRDAARWETKPAMVDVSSGRTLTYGELAGLVRRPAAGLTAEGIGKGDVVALHSPNTILFPVVLYATTTADGTVTTLSPLATPAEIAKQLIDAEARLMVSASALIETARAAVGVVRQLTGRDIEILVSDRTDGHRPVLELLSDGEVPAVELDPAADVAVLPYSSGTTGVPKGVMLSHRNLCTNLEQLNALHQAGENDRVIAILPFFHIFGLTALVNSALRRGATVYVHARFDLDAFLTSLERDRITHAYVAPPVMLALAKHPAVGSLDLSHLRHVICAAAPLNAGLQAAVAGRLAVEVGQAYGMTERIVASGFGARADWSTGFRTLRLRVSRGARTDPSGFLS